MRTTFALLLTLLTVTAVQAQAPAHFSAPAAPVPVGPVPSLVSGGAAPVEAAPAEARLYTDRVELADAARQPRSRTYWFLVGVAVALGLVLVLAL
jgi:hypothetical protein